MDAHKFGLFFLLAVSAHAIGQEKKYSSPEKEMVCEGSGAFPITFSIYASGLSHGNSLQEQIPIESIRSKLDVLCDPSIDRTRDSLTLANSIYTTCKSQCMTLLKHPASQMACADACDTASQFSDAKISAYRIGRKGTDTCQARLKQVENLISQNSTSVSQEALKKIIDVLQAPLTNVGNSTPPSPARD